VPREFDVEKDGIRYQDSDFAVVVDAKIKNFLDIMNVPYTIVRGDLATRVKTVKEKIGFVEKRKRCSNVHEVALAKEDGSCTV
jgi:hypothetical protein